MCRRRTFYDVRVLKRPSEIVCPFKVCAEATLVFLFRPSSPFQMETRLLWLCLHPLHLLPSHFLPSSSIFLIRLPLRFLFLFAAVALISIIIEGPELLNCGVGAFRLFEKFIIYLRPPSASSSFSFPFDAFPFDSSFWHTTFSRPTPFSVGGTLNV